MTLFQVSDRDNRENSGDSRGKATFFLKELRARDIVLLIHFLADVTQCLGMLSKAFQQVEATVSDIHEMTEVTIKLLLKYKEK